MNMDLFYVSKYYPEDADNYIILAKILQPLTILFIVINNFFQPKIRNAFQAHKYKDILSLWKSSAIFLTIFSFLYLFVMYLSADFLLNIFNISEDNGKNILMLLALSFTPNFFTGSSSSIMILMNEERKLFFFYTISICSFAFTFFSIKDIGIDSIPLSMFAFYASLNIFVFSFLYWKFKK